MKQNPVGWFEIYVDDMPRAQRFYESVLDVALEKLGDPTDSQVQMMAFPMSMDLPGASGALVKTQGLDAGANSTLIYLLLR
ncbi:VOC family protein [Dokdonella sp.]|uniref:VOC family protein n=1 Tax=Dokdonella sp. TaxID=2291710 RepID=UPI003C37298D